MMPKTNNELAVMRKAGKILADILAKVAKEARPGVSLVALNRLAEKLMQQAGVIPAFKGYKGYQYATCLSLNSEIVHGMPRQYHLQEGDILGVDIGISLDGLYVDSALTVGVGKIAADDRRLLKVTKEALIAGIKTVRAGRHLGDVQATIQESVESAGFTIVKDLCGHGIGYKLQDDPQIPNFGRRGTGPVLEAGQTIALEPMVSYASPHTATKPDGWTVVTLDGRNAAHFEHTVVVTKKDAQILTAARRES